MRSVLRIGLALLIALGVSTAAVAQVAAPPVSLNASLGPSFGSVGTTFATTAGLDFALDDRTAIVGEFGILPRAPFRDASEIAPPALGSADRVNAYHWNTNLKVRPVERRDLSVYLTGGIGAFTADVIGGTRTLGNLSVQDRRRATNVATNAGAGLLYRINDWVGLVGDYRTFFVHRGGDDPRVHRFTTGLALSLR